MAVLFDSRAVASRVIRIYPVGRVSKTATVAVFKTDKTGPVYRCFRAVYRKGWFGRVGFIEKPVGYPYRAASVRPVTVVTGPVTNGKVNPACRFGRAGARICSCCRAGLPSIIHTTMWDGVASRVNGAVVLCYCHIRLEEWHGFAKITELFFPLSVSHFGDNIMMYTLLPDLIGLAIVMILVLFYCYIITTEWKGFARTDSITKVWYSSVAIVLCIPYISLGERQSK
jgi:hypothetical protein